MRDTVELKVDGIAIQNFLSYRIESDLYTPADAFHLELANPETDIKAGKLCELWINGTKELTGIIDKVSKRINKHTTSLIVEGRDLMGLLVDFHCEQNHWKTVAGMKLKALAEMLLANVPFINRKNIVYQENIVGKLKSGKKTNAPSICDTLDTAQRIGQIEPGMTIFEVLKNYSLSRGLLFYCRPNGTLVFGRPLTKGSPEYVLKLTKNGTGNNVIESDITYDISRRYKKVLVVGQQQGANTIFASQINTQSGTQEDPDFPFYKLFVTKECNDNVSPAMRARLIMEKQRMEGMQYHYTVARHNQNGQNWTSNKMCHVKDEPQGIDGDYLIYGRLFEMNKQNGPTTRLRLGKPGLVV